MMHPPGSASARRDGIAERLDCESCVDHDARSPANYPASVEIDDRREIQPTLLRPNVRDIGYSRAVCPRDYELSVEHIFYNRMSFVGLGSHIVVSLDSVTFLRTKTSDPSE